MPRSRRISICLIDEHMARGLSREDAVLAARKSFGGVDQIKERYRDQRGLPFFEMLIQDVRFALRLMRKNAMFSLTAAGSLALSIGALTIAYSAVNAFVFKPLPIADPERVVYLQNGTIAWSYPDYRDLQERLDVEALAGYRIAMMNVGLEPEPSILWGYLVTGNYFEALGVTPAAGRFFTPQEDAGEAPGCGARVTTPGRRASPDAPASSAARSRSTASRSPSSASRREDFTASRSVYRPEVWVPMTMQAGDRGGSSWLATRATQNLWVVARLRRARHPGRRRGEDRRGRRAIEQGAPAQWAPATPPDAAGEVRRQPRRAGPRLRVGTVRPWRAADAGGLLEPRRPAARQRQRSRARDRACEPRSAPARRASRGNC